MQPTHRAIITTAMLNRWFTKIADAHRNPNGAFYELKSKPINNISLISENRELVEDAVFLISEASDLEPSDPHDLYLTILDRKYMNQINEVRWKIRIRDSYWHTGKLGPPTTKLHQKVFQIANGRIANGDIHHQNFFTFDNRAKNLQDLTPSAHKTVHDSSPALNGCFMVNSDATLVDLVSSVK